jgi:hypothetical protein
MGDTESCARQEDPPTTALVHPDLRVHNCGYKTMGLYKHDYFHGNHATLLSCAWRHARSVLRYRVGGHAFYNFTTDRIATLQQGAFITRVE